MGPGADTTPCIFVQFLTSARTMTSNEVNMVRRFKTSSQIIIQESYCYIMLQETYIPGHQHVTVDHEHPEHHTHMISRRRRNPVDVRISETEYQPQEASPSSFQHPSTITNGEDINTAEKPLAFRSTIRHAPCKTEAANHLDPSPVHPAILYCSPTPYFKQQIATSLYHSLARRNDDKPSSTPRLHHLLRLFAYQR